MVPAVGMGFVVRQASFSTSCHAVWGCKYPQMSPAFSFSGKSFYGGWPMSQAHSLAAGRSVYPEGSQHSPCSYFSHGHFIGVAGARVMPQDMTAKLINFLRLFWVWMRPPKGILGIFPLVTGTLCLQGRGSRYKTRFSCHSFQHAEHRGR